MPSDLFPSSDGKKLDSALRGLHATPTAPLPFLSGVVVRSFILEREQGNVIVYNAPGITAARKEILALGSADSPYGRAFGNVADRKTCQSAEPLRNFASRLPAVS